ncbi:MAG: hypothetical protein U0821_20085 [Chloroflexota bacterium]
MAASPDRETADFLYLLDRLEEMLSGGSKLPLTSRTMIDTQECLEIVEQLRVCVPEELHEARQVLGERELILREAHQDRAKIIRQAESRARRMVEEHQITQDATQRAAELEDRAARTASRIHTDAEAYAEQLLQRLASRLEQALDSVHAGIDELRAPPDGLESERPPAALAQNGAVEEDEAEPSPAPSRPRRERAVSRPRSRQA